QQSKTAEPTPPASPKDTQQPASTAPAAAETQSLTAQSDKKKASTSDSPPFSPSSTTPVLEKDDLDFVGTVNVNDEIPTEKDLKKVGDQLVLDNKGASRQFKELYQGEGVAPKQLIIFIRHFFCGNCQEYLRTLSSAITPEMLLALPTPTFITVIGCGSPDLIDMYAKETGCPFPIYADPTRRLYDLLGMTSTFNPGNKPEYIHSNMFLTSVQSVMQALKTGTKATKGGDFKQVGGEFLFEDGDCVWVHRMRNTRDHAEVTDIKQRLGLDSKKPPMRKRWSHGIKEMGKGRVRSTSWGKGRIRSKSRGAKGTDEGSLEDVSEKKVAEEKK
ncbi:hypothetical protein P154DRAFT_412767, partial [Amniculicola lignicola CBS 123094]